MTFWSGHHRNVTTAARHGVKMVQCLQQFLSRFSRYSARYCYGKSVCLSVCPALSGTVSKCTCRISSNSFRRLVGAWLKFFERYRRCKIPRTHSARALNMRGLGKIATFVRNLRLFRKRYEIGPWLPWITNRKSLVADRSDFSSSDLEWPWKWNAMGQFFWRLSI